MSSGYTTALPTTMVPDVAVLKRDIASVSTVMGVTRGGVRFDPDVTWDNIPFDGKKDDIEGLDRTLGRRGRISGTFIEIKDPLFNADILEPGVSLATAGTPTTITHTPVAAGTLLNTGDYIQNLLMVMARADGKSVVVRMKRALCKKYSIIGQDPQGNVVDCEFESRLAQSDAASSTDTASYVVEIVG